MIPKFLPFNMAELSGVAIKCTALANKQEPGGWRGTGL